MNNYNRNKDLTEVFNEKWNANYKTSENIINKKKEFDRKMFNIKEKEEIRKEMREFNHPNSQVDRLNKKIELLNNINRSKFW